jgi:hypothetical protein
LKKIFLKEINLLQKEINNEINEFTQTVNQAWIKIKIIQKNQKRQQRLKRQCCWSGNKCCSINLNNNNLWAQQREREEINGEIQREINLKNNNLYETSLFLFYFKNSENKK